MCTVGLGVCVVCGVDCGVCRVCGECGVCGGVGPLRTFDIPQTSLVATLDTYDFMFFQLSTSFHYSTAKQFH
jgi:hypothetical protein